MTHPIYIAEFDEDFMTDYRQFCSTSPVALFTAPKIFLHDPAYPCTNKVFVAAAEEKAKLPFRVLDAAYTYNSVIGQSQLVLALQTTVDTGSFIPYAVLMNDPYDNQNSRRYTRSLISSILDMANGFHMWPFAAPNDVRATLIDSYTPVVLDNQE